MIEQIFRYVRHSRVNEYAALGWRHVPALEGTHHGEYAVLMQWMGDGEPVEPPWPLQAGEQVD